MQLFLHLWLSKREGLVSFVADNLGSAWTNRTVQGMIIWGG